MKRSVRPTPVVPFAVATLLFSALLTLPAFGERVEPAFVPNPVGQRQWPAAPRIAQKMGVLPAATLPAARTAVPEKIDAVRQWNDAGREPVRNGFARTLGDTLTVTVARSMASKRGSQSVSRGVLEQTDRGLVWSGLVQVTDAYRVRLHLENVHIPESAVLWTWGEGEEPQAFGRELIDDMGGLWTPSVGGGTVYLELEIPSASADQQASFSLQEVMEIVPPGLLRDSAQSGAVKPEDSPSCLIDVSCVSSSTATNARNAMAQLQYVVSGSSYVCSGGLLNDKDTSTVIPYLLTANHCFSTQTSASSLEAFWDYRTSSCAGTIPSFSSLQKSSGSTLLATSSNSDFTFVRLNSIPGGRWLMGWDSTPPAAGTTIYRISFPFPDSSNYIYPESYSTTVVDTNFGGCSTLPRPRFLYSTGGSGGTYPGSSGSMDYLSGDYVIGQLFGRCGSDPSRGCDPTISTVDGAFSQTYSSVSQYLNTTTGTTTCTPSSTVACMLSNRFQVSVVYVNHFASPPSNNNALVKSVTGFADPKFETAFFYFNSANSIEILIKIIDQGRPDGRIDFLYGSCNPFELNITVLDTKTNQTKTYHTPKDAQSGVTDFGAFPP